MEEYREYESPYDKLRREPPDKKTWKATLGILSDNEEFQGKTATIFPDDFPDLIFYAQVRQKLSDNRYFASIWTP